MGMFDYLLCEYALPIGVPDWLTNDIVFQTKDTESQYMETYVITEQGRLIHQAVKYETVPEEERPYYGKPEWETATWMQICGMIRKIPIGNVDTNFHGDLHFHGMSEKEPYDFCGLVARFTNGWLEWIRVE
jgi:hypothetical protein